MVACHIIGMNLIAVVVNSYTALIDVNLHVHIMYVQPGAHEGRRPIGVSNK